MCVTNYKLTALLKLQLLTLSINLYYTLSPDFQCPIQMSDTNFSVKMEDLPPTSLHCIFPHHHLLISFLNPPSSISIGQKVAPCQWGTTRTASTLVHPTNLLMMCPTNLTGGQQ